MLNSKDNLEGRHILRMQFYFVIVENNLNYTTKIRNLNYQMAALRE